VGVHWRRLEPHHLRVHAVMPAVGARRFAPLLIVCAVGASCGGKTGAANADATSDVDAGDASPVCAKSGCITDGGPSGDATRPGDATAPDATEPGDASPDEGLDASAVCPTTEPVNGAACSEGDLRCDYKTACNQLCVCGYPSGGDPSATTWTCNKCLPPCPPTLPPEGSSCAGYAPEICTYPPVVAGCAKTVCSCDDGSGLWSCPSEDCFPEDGGD
jgi:hypothetical protein